MPDIICLGDPVVDMVCTQPARDLAAASYFDKLSVCAPLAVHAAPATQVYAHRVLYLTFDSHHQCA